MFSRTLVTVDISNWKGVNVLILGIIAYIV